MAGIEFHPDDAGIREMLTGMMLPDLQARAERVAERARSMGVQMSDGPLPFVVEAEHGTTRARARVWANHPGAEAAEAKYRVLGQSIDAAG